ncbi:MAG: BamA/TamA family outer membrane protein [Gemmatimonadota bacterium]|nr:BamA/TamA family outer membrane protein [Gemmatimonadota bacterium]MDE2984196.1 BamA/TamA family outer membrane protein [Gemmatimonadota bacterium]
MRPTVLLLLTLLLLTPARPAAAQAVPPNGDWRQISTEHFVITYPGGLRDLGARAATSAERAYELLADRFVDPPEGRIQLLLSDHTDLANGWATPFPYNQVTVFVRPPMDGGAISYFDDWLDMVIVHELVHTFHLDMTGFIGKVIRTIFGRTPGTWPIFPSGAAPTWVLEGLATYFESAFTGAGRVKGTWQEMVLRTAALEGGLDRLDQASGDSPVWPGGNRAYVYGARYFDHVAETYGEEALGDFARSVAGLWAPYFLDMAARDAFGAGVSESWDAWSAQTTEEYRDLAAALAGSAPLTAGESVETSGRQARQAMVSPDGATLALVRSDGVDATQIRVSAPDGSGSRRLTRLNGANGTVSWASDGTLLFSQLDFTDRYHLTSDLYLATLDGSVRRLTRGQRLTYADVSGDGRRIVAVQERGGTNTLVLVDPGTGAVTPLTDADPNVHWAHPRWSPGDDRIAATRWSRGAMDIVILGPDGRVTTELTSDRALDMTPFWTPDGSTVVWSSDRTGIPNLYAATLREGAAPEVRQVTNILGGATHPSVDPQGRWIHFSSYHADGWHIERIPFAPGEWFTPQPPSDRFAEAPVASGARAGSTEASRGYRPWSTLRPYYWRPLFRSAERGMSLDSTWHDVIKPYVGMSTEGQDMVGRHRYSFSGRLSLDAERFTGSFGYSYYGLGNPVLGLSIGQSHDALPRTIPVLVAEDETREYFLLERERWARASMSAQRRRYRSVVGFSLSGSLVQERLTLQDLQGSPGPELSRPAPRTTFLQTRTTLSVSNVQRRSFSVSREDGMSAWISARGRREAGLQRALRGLVYEDQGFGELTGELAAYKGLGVWGFANHVLALRASGGVAGGAGAHQGHFDVGGAEGTPEGISGFALFGGSPELFPVRGYRANKRFGRVAWSTTAEYRFPIALIDRGVGPLPLFFDRLYGSVFFDAGNAWGPVLREETVNYYNPRRSAIMSFGAEASMIVVPVYQGGLTVRFGAGVPLVDGDGPRYHVRVGNAF